MYIEYDFMLKNNIVVDGGVSSTLHMNECYQTHDEVPQEFHDERNEKIRVYLQEIFMNK